MFSIRKPPQAWLAVACALLGLPGATPLAHAQRADLRSEFITSAEAQFRGCDAEGWCRFWIEPWNTSAGRFLRVRPDGITRLPKGDSAALALRDRLNALLAGMIHQSKRIVLHQLRELDDGTFAAEVTVNEADLADDAVLRELGRGTVSAP